MKMLQRLTELVIRRWLDIEPLSRYHLLCALAIMVYAALILLPSPDAAYSYVYGRYNVVTDTITVYPMEMSMAAARGYYVPTMEEIIRHEEIHKSQRTILLFAMLLGIATPIIIGLKRLALGVSTFLTYQSIINVSELIANLFSGSYSGFMSLYMYTFQSVFPVALTVYIYKLAVLENISKPGLIDYIDGRLGLREEIEHSEAPTTRLWH